VPACAPANNNIQGSGIIASKAVESVHAQSITIKGAAHAYIQQGNQNRVIIKADDNILPLIQVQQANEAITLSCNQSYSNAHIEFIIELKKIEKIICEGAITARSSSIKDDNLSINLLGSCKFTVEGMLDQSQLTATLHGSSRLDIQEIDTEKLTVIMDGTSKLTIKKGSTDKQKAQLHGSIAYDTSNIQSNDTKIEAAGTSTVLVNAHRSITIDADGVNTIVYSGNPSIKYIKTRGLSKAKSSK
jgi:hypothetical protein